MVYFFNTIFNKTRDGRKLPGKIIFEKDAKKMTIQHMNYKNLTF